jgi:adenosylhomocysteine nucleosidase
VEADLPLVAWSRVLVQTVDVVTSTVVKRVGMLAPMQHELAPIVRRLQLEGDGSVCRGRFGDREVVAMLTNIGMAAGADAARRMLELDVEWIMVVGIAGGVDPDVVAIGDVISPDVVVDRATGDTFRPSARGGGTGPRGVLSCGDELITDAPALTEMAADGVIAVDMETAAVAAVCAAAGCPWSVHRSISDFAGGGLIDDALFALTRPDGTADPDALERYLDENPDRLAVLTQLAQDMTLATEAAAEAAIRSYAEL